MLIEKIDLYEYFHIAREGAERGTLTCFRHTQVEELRLRRLRPAVLVIPGGAYAFVSQKEAEPVALRYFARGSDSSYLVTTMRRTAIPSSSRRRQWRCCTCAASGTRSI